MALEKKQVGFPFIKGINTKQSPKAQATGELTDCVNFRMDRAGRLDRREGFQQYGRDISAHLGGGTTTIGSAKALTHLKDDVLLLDGENAYSRTTDGNWINRGGLLDVRNECSLLNSDMQSTSTNASYAISGNYEYIVWAEQPFTSEGLATHNGTGGFARYKYMIRDRHTGATVMEATEFPTVAFMDTRRDFTGTAAVSSSNVVLTGSINPTASTSVVGVDTLFLTELAEGISILVSGETRVVASITSNTTLTVTVAFSDVANDTSPEKIVFRTITVSGGTLPSLEVSIGDYVEILLEKRQVTGIGFGTLTVDSQFGAASTGQTMTIWKDTGPDALYWAPRIRLLAPTGSKYVYALLQTSNKIYAMRSMSDDLNSGLPFMARGYINTAVETDRKKPVWDADWMVTNSSEADQDDIGLIIGHYTHTSVWDIEFHSINAGGTPTRELTTSVDDGAGGAAYTVGLISADVVNYNNPTWQPFVKVIHDEDSDGVPQASASSKVFTGFTASHGALGLHNRVWLYDHDLDRLWDNVLYTLAAPELPDDWTLTRVGVGYDANNIYTMAELQDGGGAGGGSLIVGTINGAGVATNRPQNSAIVTSRFDLGDGSLGNQQVLWTNMSVHSDGFMIHGSTKSKCYWWLSGSQFHDSLNSMTFLADQDGKIHAHGVKGRAAINTSLEARAHHSLVSTRRRNLQCGVSRVTPGRWSTAGSTEFWCGSSMADNASEYGYLKHYRPALLAWDTSPPRPLRNQEAHGILYIGGGLLWAYDGNKLCETEFLLSPRVTTAIPWNAGLTALPDGKYSYYVVFEYVDDGGSRHVSAPAGPFAITILASASTYQAKIDICVSQLTNCRFSGAVGNPATYAVKIYRTNTDGVVHYLHAILEKSVWGTGFSPASLITTYIDSDPAQHDVTAEALIWDIIGAESAGTPISSPVDVTRHKDSLIVSNTENVVYSSTGLIPGIAAILPGLVAENAGAFGLYGDSQNERISHVVSNGLVCLFFTKGDGYAFEGEGPDSRAQGGWSAPIKFAPGQGVRPDGFIAATPMGVIYSSQNGIYLVTNDMKSVNIGAPVADYNSFAAANDPVVLDGDAEVIIPIKGDSSINGSALVYNYFFKQWYRYEIDPILIGSNENVEWISWVDENAKPVLYLVDSQGALYRQKDGTDSQPYADSNASGSSNYYVDAQAETSWMQFPGYGGRMRCYRISLMGSYADGDALVFGGTTLLFTAYSNFASSTVTESWLPSMIPLGSGQDNAMGGSEIVFKPAQQKLDSIRVTIAISGSATERGWSPEGLIFEVGQRPVETRFKVDANKTAIDVSV